MINTNGAADTTNGILRHDAVELIIAVAERGETEWKFMKLR